jgi:hypothetical protein
MLNFGNKTLIKQTHGRDRHRKESAFIWLKMWGPSCGPVVYMVMDLWGTCNKYKHKHNFLNN